MNRGTSFLPFQYGQLLSSPNELGFYFMARRMLQKPISIISGAVRSIIFVEMGEFFGTVQRISTTQTYARTHISLCSADLIVIYLIYYFNIPEWNNITYYLLIEIPVILSNSFAGVYRDKILIMRENKYLLLYDGC